MPNILMVPKIKQKRLYCLPACLSMILGYHGHKMSQQKIANHLEKKQGGFRTQDALHFARSRGFTAHPYKDISIDDLITMIRKGIPPLVRTKCPDELKSAHFMVVTGFDLESKSIYFNDPNNLKTSKTNFERFRYLWYVNNDQGYSKNYAITIR